MPSQVRIRDVRPAFVVESDYPWLSALLEERERFVGRKRSEWKLRVEDGLPLVAPRQKVLLALRMLDRLSRDRMQTDIPPRELRAALFREAARAESRAAAIHAAASKLGVPEQRMLDSLFADLADERLLTPIEPTSPEHLALLCNGELVAQLLGRALRVRVVARGKVRAVVRHAKLMGLLCQIRQGAAKDEVTLEISGPFALFRHTRIYARALASLVPRLSWCHAFRLEAECVMGGGNVGRLVLRAGDPIFPARELPPFDSKTEERFAKAFSKVAPDWDIVREPVAIEVGDALMFPDFELRHRATGERWLLEVVGYWTPEYLRTKLEALRVANIERLIVCVDEDRCCTDGALELPGPVIRYRRKVDARAVLSLVDPRAHATLPETRVAGAQGRRRARSPT
jgi:hypothetical protein